MPFPVPGVAENTERQLRDIANALPGETIDTSADSDYRIRANAVPRHMWSRCVVDWGQLMWPLRQPMTSLRRN